MKTSQIDRYELHKPPFTTVYYAVKDGIHALYVPNTTVFLRITWYSITIVYLWERIQRKTHFVKDRVSPNMAQTQLVFFPSPPPPCISSRVGAGVGED
jgi:hypothetical protein